MARSQRCAYCGEIAVSSQFYLFPCGHSFHTDCVMERIDHHLQPAEKEEVRKIEAQLQALTPNGDVVKDKKTIQQREYLRGELDGLVAAECPLCGDRMIESIALPLISDDDSLQSLFQLRD